MLAQPLTRLPLFACVFAHGQAHVFALGHIQHQRAILEVGANLLPQLKAQQRVMLGKAAHLVGVFGFDKGSTVQVGDHVQPGAFVGHA
ncbi:hypothetical protein D3C76_1227310 [compost metagenome]